MQELNILIEIRDLLQQLVSSREGQPKRGGDVQLHAKTLQAMQKHAPEMSEAEMDDVITRFWSRHQTYRNAANYANVLPGDNFQTQMALAARHFYWLKRTKRIEYDHRFKIMKLVP